MEVRPQKIIKANNEDIYIALAQIYGWTFEQIAEMTPYQKYVALRGKKEITFTTDAEYQEWLRNRKRA